MITFVIGYDATNSSYSRSEGFTQNSFFLLLTCPPKAITKTLHPTVPASVRWVGALKSPLRCLYVWQEGNLFWSVSVQGSRVWNVFCKGEVHLLLFVLGCKFLILHFVYLYSICRSGTWNWFNIVDLFFPVIWWASHFKKLVPSEMQLHVRKKTPINS
jgi:hypothetical protein